MVESAGSDATPRPNLTTIERTSERATVVSRIVNGPARLDIAFFGTYVEVILYRVRNFTRGRLTIRRAYGAVIRELHDHGDAGRLFRMKAF